VGIAWFSQWWRRGKGATGGATSGLDPAAMSETADQAWHAGDLVRAEQLYRLVLKRWPAHAPALSNLGMVLFEAQRREEGYALLKQAVAADPELAGARCNLGIVLAQGGMLDAAKLHLETALKLDPQDETYANLAPVLQQACDWAALERFLADLVELSAKAPAAAWARRLSAYNVLLLPLSRTLRKTLADFHAQQIVARHPPLGIAFPRSSMPVGRIRVAYLSNDFHDHATAHLAAGLFAAHDRSRFEVFAYSWSPEDGSDYQRRIVTGCDSFQPIGSESFRATAERIARDGIDILVDLKGHTGGGRPEILAYRPAPVQVSFLGLPGTLGGRLADYFITDAIATPPGFEDEFAEKLVFLPHSYQVNDVLGTLPPTPPRAELGLPEGACVFCSFNQVYKIEPVIFAAWMQILHAVRGSVLWLLQGNATAQQRLQQEAAHAGIEPARIVFAPSLQRSSHLARLQAADLFLDTHYVNGHTSASDALRAGVPVLTWPGDTFAGRVAASLVHAAGTADMAVASREQYVALATQLGADSGRLAEVRARLLRQRASPLFDTARYVLSLEQAYAAMWERRCQGLSPAALRIAEA
jgi:predicted O-linked N-acetylglucosamine transferase (SPINDLY family)